MRQTAYLLLLMFVSTFGWISCKDDEQPAPEPILVTINVSSVTNVTDNGAALSGSVALNRGSVADKGFCWSTSSLPTTLDNQVSMGPGGGSFDTTIVGLAAGTAYNVRAYAIVGGMTYYSTPVGFNTTLVGSGLLRFEFENTVDGTPIQLGPLAYTNQAGNQYSVDLLKYYVSNIKFLNQGVIVHAAGNYELVNAADPSSLAFNVSLPQGNYDEIRFLLGVDSASNVSGAQGGELDPSFGMFWDWNTGYIYFKHEGQFIDSNGDTLPLVYHYGALPALREHPFAATFSLSAGQTKTVKFRFNLNKLYRSPNVVDFNNNNIHSGGANWVNTIRENFENAFELTSIN